MNTIQFDKLDLNGWSEEKKVLDEPLLKPNPKRFIQYHDLWSFYKSIEAKFWSAEEIEVNEDKDHFQNDLDGKGRSHVVQAIAIMYLSECVHSLGISNQFSDELQSTEARCFIGFQGMQQAIHGEVMALLLDHLTEEEYRVDTVELVSQLTSVSRKLGWTEKYITDSNAPFSYRIAAYIVYLSVFNSALNTMLFHMSKDKEPLMPGLIHAVAKLRQDKESYIAFYGRIQQHLVNPVPEAVLLAMITEAIAIEQSLILDLKELSAGKLSLGAIEVDFAMVLQHCFTTGSQTCKLLGLKDHFGVKDPLNWVEIAYRKERERYFKQETVTVSTVKKVIKKETASANLMFNDDF